MLRHVYEAVNVPLTASRVAKWKVLVHCCETQFNKPGVTKCTGCSFISSTVSMHYVLWTLRIQNPIQEYGRTLWMEDRKPTSSLPTQENTHAEPKEDIYLRSSLNPPNRRSWYIPEDIKFAKHRSIRITFVQMSNLTQSANRRCAENEGRCCGTFLSVRVPRADAVKNWSDESAFSTADVEERVLSVLRHVGVYMGIVR